MKRELKLHGPSALVILLAAGWLAGCRGSSLNPKSDLELRLDAANQEVVSADRDKSLSSIAADAAEEGNYLLAKKALIGIRDTGLRDQTAEECAIRLVKAGDRTDANKLPATIQDPAVRNNTLRRLADNDVGSTDPAGRNAAPIGH